MVYRATGDSSTQSPEDMLAEARRILAMGWDEDVLEKMPQSAQSFIIDMKVKCRLASFRIQVKQLWYLRDLKDKYL